MNNKNFQNYDTYDSDSNLLKIEDSENFSVKEIQKIKKSIIKRIYNGKILNSDEEVLLYKHYLTSLGKLTENINSKKGNISSYKTQINSKIQNLFLNKKFFREYKEQIENFYEQQTDQSLIHDFGYFFNENKFSKLDKEKNKKNVLEYNLFFEKNINLFNKYGLTDRKTLKDKLYLKTLGKRNKEKDEIGKFLSIIENRNTPNSKSKEITVDFEELIYDNEINLKNIKCFEESDPEGNINYFSFNDILNDVETFGLEIGRIKICEKSNEKLKNFIHSADRNIKTSLSKNILLKKRNLQEILIYGFKDRKLSQKKDSDIELQNGFSAEKITEWYFRDIANNYKDIDLNQYQKPEDLLFYSKLKKLKIEIISASIGEDEKEKNDLFIQIKDKKTGIIIQKELQLTISKKPEILKEKKIQIKSRRKKEKKKGKELDLELLELQNLNFDRALSIWRNSNRPIGGLKYIFSIEDKDYLKETFERILRNMVKKIK